MKILIINYEFPPVGGGAGNASYFLARHLVEMGNEVAVLTSSFRGLPAKEYIDGIHIYRIPVIRKNIDRCAILEMLVFILSALFYSAGIVKKFRPEKSIAFFGIPSGPVALCIKIRFRVPYMLSLRGGDVPGFLRKQLFTYHLLAGPLIRLVWDRADSIVTNSQRLLKLAKSFSPEAEINVIPNGIDKNIFNPSVRGKDKQGIRLLTVGRLTYQKGINYLIEAVAMVNADGCKNRWCLEVAGDGPYRDRLKKQAVDLGIQERIVFSGWINKEFMPLKFQESDVFILPSLDEGMPNSILEAMASGLPVIATSVLKDEKLITDYYNGFIVPPGDAIRLAERLSILLNNNQLRKHMGVNSLHSVNQYGWKEITDKYFELLQNN